MMEKHVKKRIQTWNTSDVGIDRCSFLGIAGQSVCSSDDSARADKEAAIRWQFVAHSSAHKQAAVFDQVKHCGIEYP